MPPVSENSFRSYSPAALSFLVAAGGIIADYFFHPAPALWFNFFLICLVSALTTQLNKRFFRFSSIIVALMVLSFFGFWHAARFRTFPTSDLGLLAIADESPIIAEAIVIEMPLLQKTRQDRFLPAIESMTRTFFVARPIRMKWRGDFIEVTGKVAVSVNGDVSHLRVGDTVFLQGIFNRPLSPQNPGQYDTRYQLQARGILSQMNIQSIDGVNYIGEDGRYRFWRFIEQCRRTAAFTIDTNVSSEYAPLVKAMVLGMRNELDDEMIDSFRKTGVFHILAISGMHLGIIALFFWYLFRFLFIPMRVTAILVFGIAGVYLLLTNMETPTVRATILIAVPGLQYMVYRQASPSNTIGLAALIVLLINPCELFQPAAHLSFVATGTFLWLVAPARITQKLRQQKNPVSVPEEPKNKKSQNKGAFVLPWIRPLLLFFKKTVLVMLVLIPLVLKYTNLFAPIVLVVNPLIWFPLAIGLVSSFLLVLSGFFASFATSFFACISENSFNFIYRSIIESARNFPMGWNYLPAPYDWWLLGFYLPLVFWTLFPEYRPRLRHLALWIVAWIALGAGAGCYQSWKIWHEQRFCATVFAVGHGGATLIRFPDGRNCLFDCGSFSSPRMTGSIVAKTVINRGRNDIDLLILSHGDSDHFNALETLLRQITVRQIVVPPGMFEKNEVNVRTLMAIIDEYKIPVMTASADPSTAIKNFPELTFYHPPALPAGMSGKAVDSNAISIVVGIDFLGRKILFTGDLDSPQIDFLQRQPEHFDILFVPHHGGKSRATIPLIQWATPNALVVCDGRFSQQSATRQQLTALPYPLYSTYQSGCLEWTIQRPSKNAPGPGEIRIRKFRTRIQ